MVQEMEEKGQKEQKEQEKGTDVAESRDGESREVKEEKSGVQRARRQSCRSEHARIKTINFILADREFRRETNSSETAFPPAKTNKT